MKSGTGDDPFADDPAEDDDEPADERVESSSVGTDADSRPNNEMGRSSAGPSDTDRGKSVDTVSELPYKYRRDSVKEARTQQPMFLQDTTEDLIEGTVDQMEAEFDEDVYKTDVVEALLVAGAEGSTPAAVLRRWGYGMKNS